MITHTDTLMNCLVQGKGEVGTSHDVGGNFKPGGMTRKPHSNFSEVSHCFAPNVLVVARMSAMGTMKTAPPIWQVMDIGSRNDSGSSPNQRKKGKRHAVGFKATGGYEDKLQKAQELHSKNLEALHHSEQNMARCPGPAMMYSWMGNTA